MKSRTASLLIPFVCVALLSEHSELKAGDRKSDYLGLRRLIGKEKFDEAIERCQELINIYPDYFYLYETMAEASLYSGKLDEAGRYFEERINEGKELALSYYGLGRVYFYKKGYQTSVLAFNKAIELGIDVPECYNHFEQAYEKLEGVDSAIRFFNSLCHRHPENANNWYALAMAYWAKRDFRKVLDCVEAAITRSAHNHKYIEAKAGALVFEGRVSESSVLLKQLISQAQTRTDIASVQFLRMTGSLAYDFTDHLEWSIALVEDLIIDALEFGQFRWLAWGYNRLAAIEYNSGNYQNGLALADAAFKAGLRAVDEGAILAALGQQFLGNLELGNFDIAIEKAFGMQSQARTHGNWPEYIIALSNIAWTYHEMGVDDLALGYGVEALSTAEVHIPNSPFVSSIHTFLGLIYEGLRRYEAALTHYERAYEVIRHKDLGVRHLAAMHGNLGNAYLKLGKLKMSKAHFLKQLQFSRKSKFSREEAYALGYIGNFYFVLGRYDLSRQYYQQGLQIGMKHGLVPCVYFCSRGLGEVAEANGSLIEALDWYQKAITTREFLGYGQKRWFLDSDPIYTVESEYSKCTRILCMLGKPDSALQVAERGKIQNGLDFLTISQRKVADLSSDSLRAKILSIRSNMERIYSKLTHDPRNVMLEREQPREVQTLSEIGDLDVQYQKILDSLRTRDPKFYVLLNPASASGVAIQNQLLSDDHAILEYVVGIHRTEAFLVTRDTIEHFAIMKSRQELSDLISQMSPMFAEYASGGTYWNEALARFDVHTSAELYKLLVGPAEDHISGLSHLTIVPDDVLRGLPFEALVRYQAVGKDRHGQSSVQFLLEKFEIDYAPFASFIDPRFQVERHPTKIFLGVGNPLRTDSEVNNADQLSGILMSATARGPFRPLAGAEEELARISELFGGQSDLLKGRRASKMLFKKLAPKYKILHIAAHSSLDNTRPLSSSISLASDSDTGESGMLYAFEFFNMNLNADMAVLSACNTGRVKGAHGLEGLVRGLFFAGVPSVIATLWTIEDGSSADLMSNFYLHLKQGVRKSKALQLAKLELIKSGKADPFHWAGYVLIGDSTPIDFSDFSNQTDWIKWSVLVLAAALIQILVYVTIMKE